jgi:hypothetical protein
MLRTDIASSTLVPLPRFIPSLYIRQPTRRCQVVDRKTGDPFFPMEHYQAGDKAAFSGVYKAVHDKRSHSTPLRNRILRRNLSER